MYHRSTTILPDGVIHHVVIDLCTLNATAPRENQFILVIIDLFSRSTMPSALMYMPSTTVSNQLSGQFKSIHRGSNNCYNNMVLFYLVVILVTQSKNSGKWCL